MKKWYQDKFRRTLLDMHIEDWNPEFMRQFDPEVYFRALQKAEITAPMIYVQSHVGLCYWPTKSGVMHKGFEGCEDKMKRLFDLCNQAGMDTILYYSIIFNNREYDRHPEWRMRNADGSGSRDCGGRYGELCPNNLEYREFVKEQIREFSDYFDYKGVFFDMTFWTTGCQCDSCKARWEREVGGPMPQMVDWKDERWLTFERKRYEWLGEFAQLITDEAKKCKPGITVEHQYSGSFGSWMKGNNENVSKASDYIGTDLYGGILEQSLACKTWYGLTQNQPFQYMTSRCYPCLQEHTTTKTFDQLKQCVMMTYLHHGASFLIDAIDPVGTVNEKVYETIGKIFGETKKYESYFTHGKMVYDVGIFMDMDGKMDVEANGYGIFDKKNENKLTAMPHMESVTGTANVLRKKHIPYGIVNSWKLEEMKEHPVLVLSDVQMMSKEKLDAVREYVKSGGSLYLSGHSAWELVEEAFGVKVEGFTEESITYMAPAENEEIISQYFDRKYPLVMFEKAVCVSGESEGKVLATLTLPYTVPGVKGGGMWPLSVSEEERVETDGARYRFATIHANPPGRETQIPAMMYTEYGEGRILWSALPVERAGRYQHEEIFAGLMEMLMPGGFSFGGDASESVEYVLFDAPEYREKLMGVIETRDNFRIPKSHDIDIWIAMDKKPERVYYLDSKEELPFVYENGKAKVHIDTMDIAAMFAVEYR